MIQDRFKLIAATHLLLVKDQQVLLARRFQTGYQDGKFSVPAGHVDGAETVRQAMIREAKEEVCLDISEENLEFAHIMHRVTNRESVDFFFVCKQWQGTPAIGEPDKCDQLLWAPVSHLPANTIPYISQAIQHYSHQQPYSELGW